MSTNEAKGVPVFLPRAALGELVAVLRADGYTVVGPRRLGAAIMLGPLTSAEDLAHGWRDEQDGGRYRLEPGDPDLTFEAVVGMNGLRSFLSPADQTLFRCQVEGERFVVDGEPPQVPRFAFLGIRPCDVAALAMQDRVLSGNRAGEAADAAERFYGEARHQALLVVANCARPARTCFCASMGTGPAVEEGFDLSLTELRAGFVTRAGSVVGRGILGRLPVREPSSAELELAEFKLRHATEHMGRHLEVEGLKEVLDRAVEHPHWDEVARRCLSCGNCTLVCPTCFCSTVVDGNTLGSAVTCRKRHWESCYSHQFSYTTSGPVRSTVRGRYRHWLRHKLCTWHEQFGGSGCVGCGRCITWCPVGIDLTAEAAQLRVGSDEAGREVTA